MACRESRGNEILAHLGLLVFLMSLCNCARLTRLKALDESRGTSVHTKKQPEISHLHHGRLLIGQSSLKDSKLNGTNSTEAALDEADYQADMSWQTRQQMEKSDWQKMAMENLLKMESKVECTQDSMKLLVHDAASTPASLILVDRGHLSPLSLAKLPSGCGYTIRSTQKDLVLVAPYDGCFVIIQENYYVLPLLWWGLPVRMSCPLMGHVSQNPPMVTCHAEGMVVKTEWVTSASKIKVNVSGNWESLLTAAQRCVFGIVEHPDGVVISVRYAPCLVDKDGMHSLELAGDVETKVSCPSLLAAQIKRTESQVRGSVQESDMPGKWVYPFPTPYPSLTLPRAQVGSQISRSQNQKIPSKPNRGSNLGQRRYTPFPGFPYAYLQKPDLTTTKQPQTSAPSKSKVTPSADHFYPQMLYPHLPLPKMPRMMQPVTKSPHVPQKPPASKLQIPEQIFPSTYTEALSLLSNSYPLYLQRLLEKPGPSYPTMSEKGQSEQMPFHLFCSQRMAAAKPSVLSQLAWPEMFKSEVHQLFQLVCIQMEAALKAPDVSQPPYSDTVKGQVYERLNLLCALQRSQLQHSKTAQGQVYYSFYLFCYQQNQASKPADITQEAPTKPGNLYQALYPFYFQASQKPSGVEPSQPVTPQAQVYPQQTWKPAVTEPPQSITPEAHVYSPYFPFYYYPKPAQKPATQPPQSATSQTPVYPTFFPFYSHPKPTQKPATQQPQKATPQAQVHPRFFPYFDQPAPLQKPAVTQPPQSVTSQPQAYPLPFPFYPQPKPTQKPATRPPQLATPQAQVYPPLFQYFDQPHPPQKPAVTLPPQPVTPIAQVYPPFFYFYTHPQVAQKPAVTQAPQPAAPQNKVYEQYSDIHPKTELASVPTTVSQPQQLQPPRGQVTQPFSYHLDTLTQSKSTSRSTAEDHKDQEQQNQRCFYSQRLPENQLANIPTNTAQGQVYGPCQQSKPPAVETSERASLGNHFHYSQPPIANPLQGQVKNPFNMFYYSQQPHAMQQSDVQQFAILPSEQKRESPPSKQGDSKAEPQVYTSFLPVSYSVFSQDLETAEIPQKLSAPVLQAGRASASAQISPRAPQTSDAYEYFLQPPDGVVSLPRSSLGMIANEEPVSYFGAESPNAMWSHGAQYMVQPPLEQGKSESPNDPSQLWMPDGEQVKPVVQYEPFNIQFPEQTIHSRPYFKPYLGQHVGELQIKPAVEQRPFHKSEYKSSTHHNFKRAIDRFFSPYYNMPGDSPVSNSSVGLNSTQEQPSETGSNNSAKHKTQNLYSEPQSYVLLQHGPPGKKPNCFSVSQASFGELNYGANSKALKRRQNAHLETLESLQEKRQLKRLGKGVSSHSLGSNYMQRDGGSSSLFTSSVPNPVNLHHEQSFSADKLKPEVLKSFDLWKSRTPSDFSQLFIANVPEKTEVKSATMDQLATEMDKPLQMDKRNSNKK